MSEGMFYLKYGMFYWQERKKKEEILLAPKGTFVKRVGQVKTAWLL